MTQESSCVTVKVLTPFTHDRSFHLTSIRSVSRALQQVLTDVADQAARARGCIQRQRKFSGTSLVQTLVLGWLQQPDASLTALACTARDLGVDLSPQAVDQRFTWSLAPCLEQTLAATLTTVVGSRPAPIELLKRFPGGVYLLDSTTVSLPAALAADWQGCGGHAGQGEAAVKLQVQLGLLAWLAATEVAVVDVPLLLGRRQQLPVRRLAARVPSPVAAERHRRLQQEAQRKQQPVSPQRLALADWTILITNVPTNQLTPAEAHTLYRARWQLAQLFQLWKTHGQLDQWRSRQPLRILCEIYAKLIGLVLQHWASTVGCWQDPARSMLKAAQVVRAHASQILLALQRLAWLDAILRRMREQMVRRCRLATRKTHPGTYQCLLNPAPRA